jgi:hypothetical protein
MDKIITTITAILYGVASFAIVSETIVAIAKPKKIKMMFGGCSWCMGKKG